MNFSEYAEEYAKLRPKYPEEIFIFLSELCQNKEMALDCGTGNGQAAVSLARYFQRVIAFDTSAEQIALALPQDNVYYIQSTAEKIDVPDNSLDLVISAQAMHWFNLVKFYKEVIRIARSNAIIAAWCYNIPTIANKIDEPLSELYAVLRSLSSETTQIKYVHDCYKTIPFPFDKINTPNFFMQEKWDYMTLIGHLNTWPSVRNYQKKFGKNSLDSFFEKLKFQWGHLLTKHTVTWPLYLLAGNIKK